VEVDGAPAAAETPPTAAAPSLGDEEFTRRYATLTGQVLDHRYQVIRKLGEGGMSYVYQAQDLESGDELAVKILLPRLARDPSSVERLRREAAIAMRFEHPNVCPITRVGQSEDGIFYLVMPFLPGEPLNEHETRRGPYPLGEGITLLVEICHGLQHAHERGIVHRDLKPENVMLVPDPEAEIGFRAVVMDFGLAKQRQPDPKAAKLTETGIVLGTPEFMSPEQIRGKPLDGRSDIYALGVLAYELFSGQLPFAGRNAQDTMMARLRGQPISIRTLRPDLPQRLDQVLTRTLALQPDDRYRSMDELAHAFEAVTAGGLLSRLFGR
jgi:serine/threonine-protein kinase